MAQAAGPLVQVGPPPDWGAVSLIVNASSAGLNNPQQSPLALSSAQWAALPAHALVYDMVYVPAQTRLMREARAHGVRAAGGLDMLGAQAALAFARWTGHHLNPAVFVAAAQTALQEASA